MKKEEIKKQFIKGRKFLRSNLFTIVIVLACFFMVDMVSRAVFDTLNTTDTVEAYTITSSGYGEDHKVGVSIVDVPITKVEVLSGSTWDNIELKITLWSSDNEYTVNYSVCDVYDITRPHISIHEDYKATVALTKELDKAIKIHLLDYPEESKVFIYDEQEGEFVDEEDYEEDEDA